MFSIILIAAEYKRFTLSPRAEKNYANGAQVRFSKLFERNDAFFVLYC